MKEKEIERLFNKALCERYPFLIPRNVWTDSIVEDYNYEFTELDSLIEITDYYNLSIFMTTRGEIFTELDGMPDGWRKAFGIQFMEELREELIKVNNLNTFRIIQIKEKFGGLRFYINGAPPNSKIYDIIDKYEDLSFEICEFCGAPGKTEDYQGWLFTWCKNCKNKIKNRK